MSVNTQIELMGEFPELVEAVVGGGAFGGDFAPEVARGMFSKTPEAIAAAKDKTTTISIDDRTWVVRLPIVNSVLFETDEGLVVVDTGMAPGGPALVDAIRAVTTAPIHTIIYTHAHCDHAFGTWALVEASETRPHIVAHADAVDRVSRYIKTWGKISRYMSQPPEHPPTLNETFVEPDQVFHDRLSLDIGGERFDLVHRRGETDDQCYVSVPGRRMVASADYYQGFIPNAGNGKRVQRYIEDWALALREMAALDPVALLPAHGEPVLDEAVIQEDLGIHAELLEHIAAYTIDALNGGKRQDEVYQGLQIPPHLARHPTLNEQYVSPSDISKMVMRQYVGWWDDIPAHWAPAPFERLAAEYVDMAGGLGGLIDRARTRLDDDLRVACELADWAWLAAPDDPEVLDLIIEAYRARIVGGSTNTQEVLVYLDHMARARERKNALPAA